MKHVALSRRFVLRGAAGVGIALPFLEAMVGHPALAQTVSPKRYLLGFAGCSLGGYDGNINDTIVPDTVGAGFALKPGLAALAPVKEHVSLVTGLRIPTAVNGVVPAGGRPVAFHGNSHAPQLCGMRTQNGNFGAPSTEHLAGALLGPTTFPALVVRVQVSSYVGAASAGSGEVVSYRRNGTSIQAVPARYSPQQLFQALFGNFSPSGLTPAQAAEQEWLLKNRKSVLDGVKGRYERLSSKLGADDKRRVDDHLQEVRELERRVGAIPPPAAGVCQRPMDPGADPAVGGGQATPNGNITYSQNLGYSGEEQRAVAMVGLVHMALSCDLTRSVLFQFTNPQSFLNMSQTTGQLSDLHELSHGSHGNRSDANTTFALGRGINWHMKHWASLLGKLQATREAGGTILDNTAAAFTFEGGHGFDPADGRMISAHSTENMAVLVAGGAGGLKKGLHLRGNNAHPASVLLSCLKAVGSTQSALGEISAEVPGLRG